MNKRAGKETRGLLHGQSSAGFTLIELLVVISIISLISSIVLVAVKNARDRAYDTRRLADLSSLQKAFELYYQDRQFYPTYTALTGGGNNVTSDSPNWATEVAPQLLGSYLQSAPQTVGSGVQSVKIGFLHPSYVSANFGQDIYYSFSNESNHYSQALIQLPDRQVCFHANSYLLGYWQSSSTQTPTFLVSGFNGPYNNYYLANTFILGGNVEDPATNPAACTGMLNP